MESVRLSGGGASAFWRQMFADVFHKRVVTLETQEGSAYGAALLALAGEYASVPEVCRVAIRETSTALPNEEVKRDLCQGPSCVSIDLSGPEADLPTLIGEVTPCAEPLYFF